MVVKYHRSEVCITIMMGCTVACMGEQATQCNHVLHAESSHSTPCHVHAGPVGRRLVGGSRIKNPLSMQHLSTLTEGSPASGAPLGSNSQLMDGQSGQLAEPEEGAWEHILPAASTPPRKEQTASKQMPAPDSNMGEGKAEPEGSSGQQASSSFKLPGQPMPRGYQQQPGSASAPAAPTGASGMSQEQRDDRAAFVTRTNEQLAQAAAAPAAGQAQHSSNGAGQPARSALEARRRRLLAMRMTELRPLCKEQRIPMHGTKAVIVERLLDSTQ